MDAAAAGMVLIFVVLLPAPFILLVPALIIFLVELQAARTVLAPGFSSVWSALSQSEVNQFTENGDDAPFLLIRSKSRMLTWAAGVQLASAVIGAVGIYLSMAANSEVLLIPAFLVLLVGSVSAVIVGFIAAMRQLPQDYVPVSGSEEGQENPILMVETPLRIYSTLKWGRIFAVVTAVLQVIGVVIGFSLFAFGASLVNYWDVTSVLINVLIFSTRISCVTAIICLVMYLIARHRMSMPLADVQVVGMRQLNQVTWMSIIGVVLTSVDAGYRLIDSYEHISAIPFLGLILNYATPVLWIAITFIAMRLKPLKKTVLS
ncbi:hypothetical protein [Schaalia vaccimaxillae]|uniref:hypothetical protein n=1 Tax=Schaalia vaccimaxillae TaxID=183916 RepID=UPI00103EDB10|nr:hypothetical protein [Schaalia vaccimaxillae]